MLCCAGNSSNSSNSTAEEEEEDLESSGLPVSAATANASLPSRLRRMTEGLCEVLDDFGLISFVAMNISDGEVIWETVNE
jgi:hypothetical protein